MSLPLRLTLTLSIAALVLVGGVGAWQVQVEAADLRRAVRHDLELLGRSLQVSFENALRDRQAGDVQETLRELERIDPTVDVLVYDAAGALVAASTGAKVRRAWTAGPVQASALTFFDAPSPGYVELLMPLQISRDARPATMMITRPLTVMHADLVATRLRVVASVAGFVLLVALLTMALSRYWVGAPLARMVGHMRRVREGDLSEAPVPERDDEVGQTLREFGVLVRDLRETRGRLEREAEARLRLEGQLRELDKMRAVGQLAAGLAHEIGSPLQILEGRLATLDAKADDATETRRVARILLEQARRITRIVSRLTMLARRPSPSLQRFDPLGPVRTVVELLEGEARRRGVALTLHEDARVPRIDGDPDAVQQIVLNLVRNALDATPSGGHVRVTLGPAESTRPSGERGPCLRLTVEDDGSGMDDATRARAFEPFFTTRREGGGTGLGLAVVRGIVDEMGAHVDVASRPGTGTTFTIEIPTQSRDHDEVAA